MAGLNKLISVAVRVAQAFVPALARCDDEGAREVLTEAELELYMAMDVRDRAHAALVVRRLRRIRPDASRDLLAAAWLHDVGKSVLPFRPVHRIMAGLLPAVARNTEPIEGGLRGALQVKARHEAIGARLLERAGSHGPAGIVARLASPGHPAEDPDVAALREADATT